MKSKMLFLLVVLAAMPIPAYAYIDPGSGSAIMGAIVGFFVAISSASWVISAGSMPQIPAVVSAEYLAKTSALNSSQPIDLSRK